MKSKLGAAAILLAAISSSLAAQQHFPTNEDLRQLRTISSPQLSPDLKHVVVTLQDSTADGGRTHLWLLSTDGLPYRQLTFNQGESSAERNPEYLPDGSAILFVSSRDGKSSLYLLPLDGGESSAVTLERVPGPNEPQSAAGVTSYSISPDGHTIAVIASDPDPASRARNRKDKKDVIWVEHNETVHRLYLLDTKTWKAREVPTLTDMDSVAWSEQSDKLLVLTHARLRDLGPSTVGWIVSAQNPTQQKEVAGLPESTRRAAFTHQGNGLVLFAKCEKDSPEGCSDIFTLDLTSAKLHNLTVNLKDSTLASDRLTVSEDDHSVLVSITHGMKRTIAVIDLNDGHAKLLDLGMLTISAFRQQGKAKAYVYLGSSSTSEAAV
jgi:dipeptidyl aminopeptidase/acylaminoacyl peptidase